VILAGFLGLLALLLLGGGGALRLPALAGAGLVALGAGEALVLLLLHGSERTLAAVPGAALLLLAGELSFGLADGLRAGKGERRRLAGWLGGCAVGAAGAAFVVLGADAVGLRRSAVATLVGAGLAALVVWLLVTGVRGLIGEG
jgi:hypothetical protein